MLTRATILACRVRWVCRCEYVRLMQPRQYPDLYRNVIVFVQWTPKSSCSAYEMGRFAAQHMALAVINVADVDGTPVALNASEVNANVPNLPIPFLTLSKKDGDSVCKQWSQAMNPPNLVLGRIQDRNPIPDPLNLPTHMITLAMAAPLVVFVFLIVARLMRASRIHAYHRLRMELEAAEYARKENMRKDFVDGLPLVDVKTHLASLPKGQTATDELDSCTICLDDLNADDMVRILPCPCRYFFHKDCIDPWLLENGSCPTCKFEFDPPGSETSSEASDSDETDSDYDDTDDDLSSISSMESADADAGSSATGGSARSTAASIAASTAQRSIYENVTDDEDDDELLQIPRVEASQAVGVPANQGTGTGTGTDTAGCGVYHSGDTDLEGSSSSSSDDDSDSSDGESSA